MPHITVLAPRRHVVAAWLLCSIAGCGGAVPTPPPGEPTPASVDTIELPASSAAMPSFAGRERELGAELLAAWSALDAWMNLAEPPPRADDMTAHEYARVLVDFARPLAEPGAAIRSDLENVVATGSPIEAMVASVLLGHLTDRTAHLTEAMAAAIEGRGRAFMEAVQTQQQTVDRAVNHYVACARWAIAAGMRGWASYCEGAVEASMAARLPTPLPSDLCQLFPNPGRAEEQAPAEPAVVVAEVRGPAPLMEADREGLRRAIWRRLGSELEVPVLPLETYDQAAAVAAEGRIRPDGPICAVPPAARDVVAAAHPEAAQLTTLVRCTARPNEGLHLEQGRLVQDPVPEGCRLEMSLSNPAYGEVGLEFAPAAMVQGDGRDLRSWERALRRRVRRPASVAIGSFRAMREGESLPLPSVRQGSVEVHGGLAADAAQAALTAWLPTLETCRPRFETRSYWVSVALDRSGNVTGALVDRQRTVEAPDELDGCVHRVVSELRVAHGPTQRFLGFDLEVTRRENLPVNPLAVCNPRSDDRRLGYSAARDALSDQREALQACARGQRALVLDVVLDVGADGHVTAVTTQEANDMVYSPEVRQCAERVLRGTRWPCTTSGEAVRVQLGLGVRPGP